MKTRVFGDREFVVKGNIDPREVLYTQTHEATYVPRSINIHTVAPVVLIPLAVLGTCTADDHKCLHIGKLEGSVLKWYQVGKVSIDEFRAFRETGLMPRPRRECTCEPAVTYVTDGICIAKPLDTDEYDWYAFRFPSHVMGRKGVLRDEEGEFITPVYSYPAVTDGRWAPLKLSFVKTTTPGGVMRMVTCPVYALRTGGRTIAWSCVIPLCIAHDEEVAVFKLMLRSHFAVMAEAGRILMNSIDLVANGEVIKEFTNAVNAFYEKHSRKTWGTGRTTTFISCRSALTLLLQSLREGERIGKSAQKLPHPAQVVLKASIACSSIFPSALGRIINTSAVEGHSTGAVIIGRSSHEEAEKLINRCKRLDVDALCTQAKQDWKMCGVILPEKTVMEDTGKEVIEIGEPHEEDHVKKEIVEILRRMGWI